MTLGGDKDETGRSSKDLSSPAMISLPTLESGQARIRAHRQPPTPSEERGFFASIRDFDEDNNWDDLDREAPTTGPPVGALTDTLYEQVVDEDDPLVTGKHKEY